jgi:hypothetical protein
MSNPCINRWGLNSFWHHYWYSDSRYASYLQHDDLALNLVQTYLTYGSDIDAKMFWNKYWFKSSTAPQSPQLSRYYRWVTVSNKTLHTVNTYRLRISSEETFQMRVSVLRFNSWLVINLYWFQPDKNKRKRDRLAKLKLYTNSAATWTSSTAPLVKLRTLLTVSHISSTKAATNYLF